MAADESRAQRIRDLKDRHPEITWRSIASRMPEDGISDRAAQQWRVTGGIKYENAQELNRIFQEAGEEIPDDYIWRGEPTTPDPFRLAGQMDGGFEEFRLHVASLHDELRQLRETVDALADERAEVLALLKQQSELLSDIRGLVRVLQDVQVIAETTPTEVAPLPSVSEIDPPSTRPPSTQGEPQAPPNGDRPGEQAPGQQRNPA